MFYPIFFQVIDSLYGLPIPLLQVKAAHDTVNPLLAGYFFCLFQGVDYPRMTASGDYKQPFLCLQCNSTIVRNKIGCSIFERECGMLRFKIGNAWYLTQKQHRVTDTVRCFAGDEVKLLCDFIPAVL